MIIMIGLCYKVGALLQIKSGWRESCKTYP